MRAVGILPLLALATSLQAQFSAGITAGGNLTFTSLQASTAPLPGLSVPDPVDLPGYHGGLFAEYMLGDRLGLRADVLYTVRRHSFDEAYDTLIVFQGIALSGEVELESQVRRQYLEVPLALVFRPATNVSLRAGPAIGLLLGSNVSTTGEVTVSVFGFGTSLPFTDVNTSTTGLNTALAALHAAVGYRTAGGLDLGLAWWHGLGWLEEDDNAPLRTRQHQLRLSVGWAFVRGGE